jgi:hypothetical protein
MGHRTIFSYDHASNLTCGHAPDLGLACYEYDLLNRMASVKDPLGEVASEG